MLLPTAYLVWIQMSNIVLVKINFGTGQSGMGPSLGCPGGFAWTSALFDFVAVLC